MHEKGIQAMKSRASSFWLPYFYHFHHDIIAVAQKGKFTLATRNKKNFHTWPTSECPILLEILFITAVDSVPVSGSLKFAIFENNLMILSLTKQWTSCALRHAPCPEGNKINYRSVIDQFCRCRTKEIQKSLLPPYLFDNTDYTDTTSGSI